MDILQIVDALNHSALGWGAIVILLLSVVQISPIKINPWSWIAQKLGHALTHESCNMMAGHMTQIDSILEDIKKNLRLMEKRLEETEDKADMDRAIASRIRIIRFNDELINEQKHSKESFDQVMGDIDTYEHYCEEHPKFRNNKSVMSIENIKRVYAIRLEKRDFHTGETEE